MDFIVELLNNQVFVSAALGWLVAQVLKTLIHLILTKRFVVETAAGIKYGGGSFEFAIAVMLSIIVMYDAMGVRRETGKQGQVLNEMMEIFTNMGNQISPEAKLKELVGHTPLQVLMGAILGIIIAVTVNVIW